MMLPSLSNSSTVTVGDLWLEGYDPSLELGRWELRWDENQTFTAIVPYYGRNRRKTAVQLACFR
ncbi:hypothetical protein [Gemmiger formicilis]|uniref:hypothetical protein n=1 Tax=Gemmiger formicilis TaxID=745368 RepID=UPI003AB3FA06